MSRPSTRAQAVTLRTYCRPLDEAGTSFEPWERVVRRSTYDHHKRLWEQAGGEPEEAELVQLTQLGLERKALVAGRTLWLGGTPYAYDRACCQFNCCWSPAASVYDVVDISWLLLNGCGVGFQPKAGILHGFVRPIDEVEVVPSTRRADEKGSPKNVEVLPSAENDFTWTLRVGDSAEAWAKAIGKLLNPGSRSARKLVLDFSEVRGAGGRLKGYGWVCNGYRPLAVAMQAYTRILNDKAGDLLDEIDILDVVNHVGQILSSRRAAELASMNSYHPRRAEFQAAKKDYWRSGNNQRRQSNNSFLYWSKPSYEEVCSVLEYAYENGDPGIINASGALQKASYFDGLNPCGETLLGKFCNLFSFSLRRFRRNYAGLEKAVYLAARANYRQACVDLRDGVLQPVWHQANEAQRLCGLTPTGVVQADWLTDYQIRRLRNAAVYGAYSMADELGLPRPKAITLVTPSGTRSKIDGDADDGETTEGIHKPLGRFILNWVNFSIHDPLVGILRDAGYRTLDNPSDPNNVLVCFPVEYRDVPFTRVDGREVNTESAVDQLNRYLRWNTLWADHNCSCTISFDKEEIPDVADWVLDNWDRGFIAVSFLRRNDPLLRPEDLGHPYLPQQVVEEGVFREYAARLRDPDWSKVHGIFDIDVEDCPGGVCPVK